MDLKQRKLNKSEWESIEISVSKPELDVLNLIVSGFHDVTTRINFNNSIFTFLKIEYSEKMEDYVFNRYLRKRVEQIEGCIKNINSQYKPLKIDANIKPNSADRTRLERFDNETIKNNDVYENVLLENLEKMLENKTKNDIKLFHYYYYTVCLLYTSPSPRDLSTSRMPSSA